MKTMMILLSAFVIMLPSRSCIAEEVVWGVTDNQFLISWSSDSPSALTFGAAISGLQSNEQILGLDFRPADNQLYAIGSTNRLYMIAMDGMATQVGSEFQIGLNGSAFGYDFNPTIDRSRVDTNTSKNYVVNPNDGSIVQVTDLFYSNGDTNFGVDPNVVHIGYTNSFDGATNTQLYAIDSSLDILTTQANSAGTLETVGEIGVDITSIGGFDISGSTGTAYGAFQLADNSNSQFFSIDLATGNSTWLGEIDGGIVVTALALQSQAVPEPGAAMFLGGLFGCSLLRRRRI